MKNLHAISDSITDIQWASAYWLSSKKYQITIINDDIYFRLGPNDTTWVHTYWNQMSKDYIIYQWKLQGSPKTKELRKNIIL